MLVNILYAGETVSFFSSPLKDLVFDLSTGDSHGTNFEIIWRDLVSTKLHVCSHLSIILDPYWLLRFFILVCYRLT